MTSPPTALDSLAGSLAGESRARGHLMELVYEDLRSLAASKLVKERTDHTLQPTALVHEAYLRLIGEERSDPQGRTHFFCLAATTMRRVLVDHARSRQTQKRGGGRVTALPGEELESAWQDPGDFLDLDEALNRLGEKQPRQARVVELRFFGGLALDEIAVALELSRETIKLDWRFARAWLNRELAPPESR